jgi:glycosyltransferase involved in cell wall biosynthesis
VSTPRVVVAVPAFEAETHIGRVLSELLAQRYEHFRVLLVDDASKDATFEVAERIAAADERLTVRRNTSRIGLSRNWNAALDAARQLHPSAELFAWAGHHDEWHPDWLPSLVAQLDERPVAVLAYPLDAYRSDDGREIAGAPPFATTGVRDPRMRLALAARHMVAGSMVYGLVRVDALLHAGGLQPLLYPDRLLIARLAWLGEFAQERRVLWRRRLTAEPTRRRQRQAIFPGTAPAQAFLPISLSHGAVLVRAGVPAATVSRYTCRRLLRDGLGAMARAAYRIEGHAPAAASRMLRRAVGLPERNVAR